ncbi:MAG: hypothetical protein ACRCYQ_07680 [Nocardioides sp.]
MSSPTRRTLVLALGRASYRRHARDNLVNRILRTRRHRLRHRSAAARFDRALLALEAHLKRTPGYRTEDFIEACRAILGQADEHP